MKSIVLKVEGMRCGHCEIAVQEAIRKLPGVKKAKASKRRQEARVDYDETRLDPAQIRAAINATGYQAGEQL